MKESPQPKRWWGLLPQSLKRRAVQELLLTTVHDEKGLTVHTANASIGQEVLPPPWLISNS